MLSIAKLRVGQEAYQLTGVAQSLDDYYTGAGEAAGEWVGVCAEALGLVGEVNGDDLRAVLAGLAPGSGGLTPNGEENHPHRNRVPGFDLTFKAPKSLSVLYAVTDDPRVQGAIIEAGEAAVRSALGWLEREAIRVRRGTGNQRFLADLQARDPDAADAARIRYLPGNGVVAAMFRHRTSRSGDPLLHWHTLVANLVQGSDGRWSALMSPDLYRAARTAGELFQAALRAEVTERLGLEWHPGRHVAEVAGVPQRLCDVFSKRSREIEAWLEATGTADTPEGRQAAVLATRRNKSEVEDERFDAVWKAEAIEAGWGPEAAEALILASDPHPVNAPTDGVWRLSEDAVDEHGIAYLADRLVDPDTWIAHMVRQDLTEHDSTFTKPQLTQAVAARLGDGATVATIERVVARSIASPELIPVVDGDNQLWTSRELVNVERRFLKLITDSSGSRAGLDPLLTSACVSERSSLGEDQRSAVAALASTENAVSVLVGPAGSGKTFVFDAVRAAYQSGGYSVIGAAPSARAALELQLGAGIESMTIHRLVGRWRRGQDLPNQRTLLVIDEAGMAGIRDLEAAVAITVGAGGRVILAGDPHQLPEITAGGGFQAAVTHSATVAQLTVNRRQQQPWEREALSELRSGHVPAAVNAYRCHGRVVVAADRIEMVAEAASRWIDSRTRAQVPVLLAGTNEMVDALNRTVRHQLAEQGLLAGEVVAAFGGREFIAGDRVVLRRNSYREVTAAGAQAAVLNGQTGTVIAGSDQHLDIRLDRHQHVVRLGEDYLQAGYVDYGYALTTHRAQGGTWDVAIAVGADGLYREAAYVQLSRGADSNWLLVTAPEMDEIDAEIGRHAHGIPLPSEEPVDIDTQLHRQMERSRAKLLALARDPHADQVDALSRSSAVADLEARSRHARTIERRATEAVAIHPSEIGARIQRAQHTARHVALSQQVKAVDRHNIGVVVGINDSAGSATVHFTSASGTQAERTFPWDEIEIVTPRHPEPRELTPEIQASIDTILEPAQEQVLAWHAYLATHGVASTEADTCERAASLAIDRAAARLTFAMESWLTDLVGERPSAPVPTRVWDDTVREIATYRCREEMGDHIAGLGPRPNQAEAQAQWSYLSNHINMNSAWLAGCDNGIDYHVPQRTAEERESRRTELQALLDSAPADQRSLIARLRTGHQLPFDNTAEVLREALDSQTERRDWILTNWPHVVELAELEDRSEPSVVGERSELSRASVGIT